MLVNRVSYSRAVKDNISGGTAVWGAAIDGWSVSVTQLNEKKTT